MAVLDDNFNRQQSEPKGQDKKKSAHYLAGGFKILTKIFEENYFAGTSSTFSSFMT